MTNSSEASRSGAIKAMIALAMFIAIVGLVFAFSERTDAWMKAFHIMSVIAWMAGLFYLPRLFIYHSDTSPESESSNLFKVMEQRLYRIIMNPAMMLTWGFGIYLALPYFHAGGNGWLHAKLTAVVAMTALHVYLGRTVKAFGRNERPGNPRRWRIVNEIPTVLMIIIVLLVVVQPF
jgi:protoporphyrinogen IX oxidase